MADPASVVGLDVTAYELSLEAPDVARDRAGNVGFWTMVYDEGFEVRLGGRVFFAFSRFHTSRAARDNAPIAPKDTAGYASECARTAPGWYHEPNASAWGCYYGVKAEAAAADASVVEAPAAEAPAAAAVAPTRQTAPPAMREISAQLWADDAPLAPPPAAAAIFLQQRGGAPNASAAAPRAAPAASRGCTGGWWSSPTRGLPPPPTAAWRAARAGLRAPEPARDQRDVGREARHRAAAVAGGGGAAGAAGGGSELLRADDHGARGKYEGLPTHWDWRMSTASTTCRACARRGRAARATRSPPSGWWRRACASRRATRCAPSCLRRTSCRASLRRGATAASPTSSASTSPSTRVDDACFRTRRRCRARAAAPHRARWRARNYRYVGGRYGGCGELAMMREIYENGPVVAGFEAGADLFYDGDGIYSQAVDAAFVELQGERRRRRRPRSGGAAPSVGAHQPRGARRRLGRRPRHETQVLDRAEHVGATVGRARLLPHRARRRRVRIREHGRRRRRPPPARRAAAAAPARRRRACNRPPRRAASAAARRSSTRCCPSRSPTRDESFG